MAPAALTEDTAAAGAKKLAAYLQRRTGDHHPNQELWHTPKASHGRASAKKQAPAAANGGAKGAEKVVEEEEEEGESAEAAPAAFKYFRDAPPQLSYRQAELFGLVPYDSSYTHLSHQQEPAAPGSAEEGEEAEEGEARPAEAEADRDRRCARRALAAEMRGVGFLATHK